MHDHAPPCSSRHLGMQPRRPKRSRPNLRSRVESQNTQIEWTTSGGVEWSGYFYSGVLPNRLYNSEILGVTFVTGSKTITCCRMILLYCWNNCFSLKKCSTFKKYFTQKSSKCGHVLKILPQGTRWCMSVFYQQAYLGIP